MSNPFGEAPPQKPTRPARPPPPNPFGPARQASVDASKSATKNPFGSTEPEYPPLTSVPLPTTGAPTVPMNPPKPPTPPPFHPEAPPAVPPALQAPEVSTPSTVPPPLPVDVAPSTPLVAPPAPPLPPSLPPSTPTGAPPPPPAIPPSLPPSTPPALPSASPTVETPKNQAPPVPVLLPQQAALESDSFDFQPVAPQSDPFGFTTNAVPTATHDTVAFDIASGSEPSVAQTAPLSVSTVAGLTQSTPAPVVEEPPSLPPPPPQVDDDPYDLHINRPVPVPQPPIAAAVPHPRKSFTEDKKTQLKTAGGDPFSELVAPLKPTPPPGVSNPFAKPANPLDSLPLNALLAAKKSSTVIVQVAPASSTPQVFVSAPVVAAGAPVRVAAADPFSAPAVPFAPPSASAAPEDFDLFDQPTVPQAAAPVAPPVAPPVPVISPADFDIFAAKAKPAAVPSKTAAVTVPVDPFAAPIDPFASAQPGAPIVEDDAFDVFGLPKPAQTQQKRPSHTLPVPPVPAKAVAHKAAPAPKATVPPPLETSQPIVPPAKRQAPTAAPTAAPPEPDFIFSPADYRKTSSHSFDHVADDPFASSVVPTHADDLFDDPFAAPANARDKEEIDDPLARLRQTYGLSAQHSDDEDEHRHDPGDVLHDAFDDFDDFTFDQAHHGGRTAARPAGDFSRPTKQSASGRSTGSAVTSKSADNATSGGAYEDGVLAQGEILSRLSTKAMLTRDWHDTYYAIINDRLYVFRHRADYFQFQAQTRNRRVQRGSTEDAAPLYKKCIDLVYNLKLEPIKGKEYKTLGMVYNFSLELIEDYGPKDLGKFGSTDRETVQKLWNHIREVVMAKRKERATPRPTYG